MKTYYISVESQEISTNIPELDLLYQAIMDGVRDHQDVDQLTINFDNEIILRYGPTARLVGCVH